MSDIHVDPGQLRGHALNVTAAADAVKDGADAADTVAMNGDAFGFLVSFVGGWFQEQESELALAFRDAVNGFRTDAVNLYAAAEEYENTDRASADRVRDAGGRRGPELPL